jgi:hypothetical protein
MRSLILTSIILIVFSADCFSQNNSSLRYTKWDFDLTTGGIIGGPCDPMLQKLLRNGINNSYESKTSNQLPVDFEANYAISKYFRLGLNINMLRQDLKWGGCECADNFYFKTIAANFLISFNFRDFIFIGAGPALNSIMYYHQQIMSATDGKDFFKPGLIIKSSVEFPKKTKVHFRFEVLYNYGAKIDPAYTIVGVGTSQTATRRIRLDDFPVNYFYAGIGLGFRLR